LLFIRQEKSTNPRYSIDVGPMIKQKQKTMKGDEFMGKPVVDKEVQLTYLKNRLEMFIDVIDHLDPEYAEIDDIDRLIQILNDMQVKVEQFKKGK
jgi:hypothetical protein